MNLRDRIVFALQVMTVSGIWVFSLGITIWIIRLVVLAHGLHDMPGGSLGISMVAVPIFLLGASVLTYVFVGLHRGREHAHASGSTQDASSWGAQSGSAPQPPRG